MHTFLYDPEDELIISSRKWTIIDGYVRCTVPIAGERFIHRILMCATSEEEVDHADGNPLNNRRSNLRKATRQQNAAARSMPKRNLPRGVTFCKRTGRYIAQIRVNGELKWLGRWDTPEGAALARDHAALEAFGEFAVLNYPTKG